MRKQRQILLLALALALLAAGCGGDGEEATATTTTAPPPVETTTTLAVSTTVPTTAAPVTAAPAPTAAAPDAAALTAKAAAAVLQQADFPAGWEAIPAADGGGLNIDTIWAELTTCLGVTPAPIATATSPTFLRDLATQARATVEYTSEASTTAIEAALSSRKANSCLASAFTADVKRSAPEGGVPGPATVAPHDVAAVATRSKAYRITAEVSLDELKVPLFQDFYVIFTKGAVIRAMFLNPGSQFPPELERTLLQKVLARA